MESTQNALQQQHEICGFVFILLSHRQTAARQVAVQKREREKQHKNTTKLRCETK